MTFPLVVDNPLPRRPWVTEGALVPVTTGPALPPGGIVPGSSLLWTPTVGGKTGPIQYSSLFAALAAFDAINGAGNRPVCTLYAALTGLTVIPPAAAFDFSRVRIVGDGLSAAGASELRFAAGSSIIPPLSTDRLLVSSAAAGPLFVVPANTFQILEIKNGGWGRPGDVPIFNVGVASATLAAEVMDGGIDTFALVSAGQVTVGLVQASITPTAVADLGGPPGVLNVTADSVSLVQAQSGFTGTVSFLLSPSNISSRTGGPSLAVGAAYGDLSPAADVVAVTGTTATLLVSGTVANPGAPGDVLFSVRVAGATTLPASDANSIQTTVPSTGTASPCQVLQLTGLTPGSNSFFLAAKALGGTIGNATAANYQITYIGP